jgi:hypothetical protein
MILLWEGLAGISRLTFRPIAYTRNCRNLPTLRHVTPERVKEEAEQLSPEGSNNTGIGLARMA